ncbi:hypothetical protein [Polaromonas sp. CG9_12]|nr:hypothetical protein [Polaromonas sp. CG9_12]
MFLTTKNVGKFLQKSEIFKKLFKFWNFSICFKSHNLTLKKHAFHA